MRLECAAVALLLLADALTAQESEKASPDQPIKIEQVVVVTASRTEQSLHDAPAAVSVITSKDLEQMPADDYGDILRNVPGLNVAQISARDIQVTGRSATGSLATSQLVLLDGRSLYLDFFGFVMWDFVPMHVSEIKQIEVVRGPGSAVWGANAMNGVINLITKRPWEMEGSSVILGGGELGTLVGSVLHAGTEDRWSYTLSAGYYRQDPYARPSGLIPGTQTPYPALENEGTKQPKADVRIDYDISDDAYLSVAAGYAGTDGLVHSGIGPFDIESGSSLSYVKGDWSRGALRATAFANFLDADSASLLAIGLDGRPISFSFKTETYNVDLSNTSVLAEKHILAYGVNARKNQFDLSLAPLGEEWNEYGGFVQDEALFGKARWVVGARWDHIDPIGSVVSPRTAVLYSPRPNHTVRLSFSRAYRAPSVINNYLDTAIVSRVTLPTGPFIVPTRATGNPDLDEERMTAYELGYVGTLANQVTLTFSLYRNREQDSVDFFPAAFYASSNPPPGWPLPPAVLDLPPLRNALPSSFSYRNVGEHIDQGVEIGLSARPSTRWSWFLNYSYQDEPEVKGIPVGEIRHLPPTHRANLGGAWDWGSYFASATVNYQDDAFWTDVLDSRFWGPTDSFTSVNAAIGFRFNQQRTTISITGTNLLDEEIQQHVFGDIISRKISGQVQFRF